MNKGVFQALRYVLLFLLSFFIMTESAYAALSVSDIRIGQHVDKTRVVVDLSQRTAFRSFMLEGPYRLVIDMPVAKWGVDTSSVKTFGGIKSIRHGGLDAGGSRIVLDLTKPMKILKAFTLPAQNGKISRLVIDLVPASKQAFLETKSKIFGNFLPKSDFANVKQQAIKPSPAVEATESQYKKALSGMLPLRKPVSKIKTIIIDAGHGGGDPGGTAPGSAFEKHLTLAIAKELGKQLKATGRYKVVLTRNNDKYIRLHQRVDLARKAKGDLFISIHADKIGRKSVRGVSIYTLSEGASDKETARLAEQENNAGIVAGVDLAIEDSEVADILLDLAMRETMNQSKFFANIVVKSFKKQGVRLLNNTHRHAGFAVLKAPDIPSVLIEAGFLSNSKDAKLLNSASYQRSLSRSIVLAIDSYFVQIKRLQNL